MTAVLRVRVKGKTWPAVAGRAPHPVLGPISLDIEHGSFVILTGPSGCGKSTLLNIMAGLDRDFDGGIERERPDLKINYVFQSPRLLPWRTVFQNVALALPDKDPRIAEILPLLERVGLAGAADVYPERLSLGMQRRAALARGFIGEPELLLMDEPFVSLDDPTAQALRQLLIGLWMRRPTTVIFVTHDRDEAVMLGTRILRMAGSPATVVEDVEVGLSTGDRADRLAVGRERQRIFGVS